MDAVSLLVSSVFVVPALSARLSTTARCAIWLCQEAQSRWLALPCRAVTVGSVEVVPAMKSLSAEYQPCL